jgi:hypothetical protein
VNLVAELVSCGFVALLAYRRRSPPVIENPRFIKTAGSAQVSLDLN